MTDNNSTPIDHKTLSEEDLEPVYASLHFYYNDPDSMERFELCNNAHRYYSAIDEYARWLRSQVKHYDNPPIICKAWDKLFECFGNNDVIVPGWE